MDSKSELYLLFECAAGYVLLHVKNHDEIITNNNLSYVQDLCIDRAKFMETVEFFAFTGFENAQVALENMQCITNGKASDLLVHFLEANLPDLFHSNAALKSEKKKKKKSDEEEEMIESRSGFSCISYLGVYDTLLGKSLSERGVNNIQYNQNIVELFRGCRLYVTKLAKQLANINLSKFQIGLAHSYSREKLQLDPNKQDKPIQHTIALIDSLNKNINTFAMRVKEWYGYHFPELSKIVNDNQIYCKIVCLIQIRDNFLHGSNSSEKVDNDDDENEDNTKNKNDDGKEQIRKLTEILNNDDEAAKSIIKACKISIGYDMNDVDMLNILTFAKQVISLTDQRTNLTDYLSNKLNIVAPNLKALVGEILSARLISHAGSLVNLAKSPSSTIQILGAEKALFRALKNKGNTPKYGLLYMSSYISKSSVKNKGKVSRYLANKCSLCARIDNFTTVQSNVFGEKMKMQMEERMNYLNDSKVKPQKNIDVMKKASEEYKSFVEMKEKNEHKTNNQEALPVEKKKKKKKKNVMSSDQQKDQNENIVEEENTQQQEEQLEEEVENEKKKKKKNKKRTIQETEEVVVISKKKIEKKCDKETDIEEEEEEFKEETKKKKKKAKSF